MLSIWLFAAAARAQDPGEPTSQEVCVETEILGPPDSPGQRADAAREVRFAVNRKVVPRAGAIDPSALANLLPMRVMPDFGDAPVGFLLDATPDPFQYGHVSVRVAVRGRDLAAQAPLPVNIAFVIETSDTTASASTLDWTPGKNGKEGLYTPTERLRVVRTALTEWLATWDRPGTVSLIIYDQQAKLLLPPTSTADKQAIQALIDQVVVGLAPTDPIPGRFALNDAITMASARPAPCEDHRIVIFTDGPQTETSVGEPIDTAARDLKYTRLSAIILPNGPRRAPEYEQLARTGRGVGWYADTTWEVLDALGRAILPPRRVAQSVHLDVEFDKSLVDWADLRGSDPSGGPLATGEQWTLLYDVMLRPGIDPRKPFATLDWTADLAGWNAAGSGHLALAAADMAPSFDKANPDLQSATALADFADLLRWRLAIHDWDRLIAAVGTDTSEVHGEMHSWFVGARAAWPGTPHWTNLAFDNPTP